jgi:hypothetical protein
MSYFLTDTKLCCAAPPHVDGDWIHPRRAASHTLSNPANGDSLAEPLRFREAETRTVIDRRCTTRIPTLEEDDCTASSATIITLEEGASLLAEARAEVDYAASFVQ